MYPIINQPAKVLHKACMVALTYPKNVKKSNPFDITAEDIRKLYDYSHLFK